ncbi:hypothetical protein ABZ490_31930 [Streptomyces sp. NPDC005811]|uniref:hypothetical protein n=1 Tax=Streptomyces sp. NPDC005811 TaxID=3154565 RepID=UPI0033EB3642
MARHASPQNPTGRRVFAALATASVALGAGAGAASAAPGEPVVDVMRTSPTSLGTIDPQTGVRGVLTTLPYVTGAFTGLKPNPLAGTGVDPLDNGVGTQVADFRPLTSQMLTAPLAQAKSLGAIPVVGDVAKVLGG